MIVVHPSLGVKTFKDLLAAAKTGERVSYISPGPGTIGHLVPELLARKENLKFTHVTYKGAGQAMTDLVAGHVKMGSVTWSSAIARSAPALCCRLRCRRRGRCRNFPPCRL